MPDWKAINEDFESLTILSPAISEDFNFSVEFNSSDKTITLAMSPAISADYAGTLTIKDVNGKSADIELTLHSFMSGDVEVAVSGDQAVKVITGPTGGVGTVTLNAGNAYGNVLWEVLNVPSGFTFTPLVYTGNPATFLMFAAETGTLTEVALPSVTSAVPIVTVGSSAAKTPASAISSAP